jgi:hypothetical protein
MHRTSPQAKRDGNSLVKSSSINADHNPRIGEQHIRLLEGLDVLKPVFFLVAGLRSLEFPNAYLEFAIFLYWTLMLSDE